MAMRFLLLCVLLATPAGAAAPRVKPPPTRVSVAPAAPAQAVQTTGPGCSVGTAGPAVYVVDYLLPPDDSYYVRARPRTCIPCASAAGVWVSSVQVALDFRVPCSQPVEVSVVTPVADTACAPPAPFRVMRGPVAAMLTAATPGIHAFSVPLEGSVALLGDAYLRVTFPADGAACADGATRPRLVTTSSCSLCVSWNYYPGDTTDLCALSFPGTPLISASVDACVPVSLLGVQGPPRGIAGLSVEPNPSVSGALVRFTLAARARVRLEILDVTGRCVRRLLDEDRSAAEHAVAWDGRDDHGAAVRPGTYFTAVRVGERMLSRRMVVLGAAH